MLSNTEKPKIRQVGQKPIVDIYSQGDYLTIAIELLTRLRKFYASLFLTVLVLGLMPKTLLLERKLTFEDYSPAIYWELSFILDHSVNRMVSAGSVQIIVSSPLSVISACIQLAVILSFILNYPILMHHLYDFISPGLYKHEKDMFKKGIYIMSGLFVLGASIAYLFVVPITLGVLTTVTLPLTDASDSPLVIYFTLDSIFSIVIWTVFSSGLLYMLPGLIYILVILNVIEVDYLVKNRKNVILSILIFAAVITPDPTMVSMLIISGPLIIIYEILITQGMKIKRPQERSKFKGEFIA